MTHSNPSSGHDPALPSVTRRALMAAVPALVTGTALEAATPAQSVAETPVLQLFREITSIEAMMNDPATGQEEFDRLYEQLTALEWRLTREPATCAADVAAKVLQLTSLRDDCGTIFEPELRAEMETLVRRVPS